jgi:hypothetical protein
MGFVADVWGMEHTPGGEAALSVLDEDGTQWLNRLMSQFGDQGMSPALERDAWMFLHAYRQLDRGVLTAEQRTELEWILHSYEAPEVQRSVPRPAPLRRQRSRARRAHVRMAAAAILIVGLLIAILALTRQTPTVPPGSSGQGGQSQPLQQPNVVSPQQQMIDEYGPFSVIANDSAVPPDTGAPAVLYIDDSSADSGLASAIWTVRFLPQAWEQSQNPLVTNIQAVAGPGQYFTFQTGGSSLIVFTVKAYQPFFLMSLPQTLFIIDGHGNLWQIYSLGAQAKHLRGRYSS